MIADENRAHVIDLLYIGGVKIIAILEVLFAPIIVVVRFKINIPPRYTSKLQRSEFSNYSISLFEFHCECIIKVVYKKREEKELF